MGDILGSQGVGQDQAAAPSGALPPGMDLPVDQDLSVGAAASPEEKEAAMRKKAFDASAAGMYPLRPDEIRRFLELKDENTQAMETPLVPTPEPESVFTTISLDPGTKPLVVKTAVGSVTTVSIVDASGQPWPIRDISWAGNFEILQPEKGGNILRITPLSEFASGNVSMRLNDLNPPVILMFKADRETVHVRMDVQIPELGPNGIAPLINTGLTSSAAGNSQLSSVLEGIAPAKSRKLTVNGVDGRTTAYEVSGTVYLRTPYTLLSPAWNSSVRSADGTNVYALGSAPVLLLSDKGKMVRAYLSEGGTTDGK